MVGDIPTLDETEDQMIIERKDGSWLIDGLTSIDECKEHFKLRKLPDEKSGQFHTAGGFVMYRPGRIPAAGDAFDLDIFHFEVVDMDGNRADKLIVKQNQPELKKQ